MSNFGIFVSPLFKFSTTLVANLGKIGDKNSKSGDTILFLIQYRGQVVPLRQLPFVQCTLSNSLNYHTSGTVTDKEYYLSILTELTKRHIIK